MKLIKERMNRYGLVFIGVILVCFLYFVSQTNELNTHVSLGSQSLQDFSEGWTTADQKQVSLMNLQEAMGKNSDAITLTHKIPDIVDEGTGLNFRSKNINFTVYVQNQEVYQFVPQLNNIVGKSYGSCFHYIPILKEMAGKTMNIVASPDYRDNGCFFNMMMLGNPGEYNQKLLQSHFGIFLVCVIIMIFGVIILLLPITMYGTKMKGSNLNALGVFAIMMGCWTGMQTMVPQMLWGHILVLHGLNYLILIFLPYPAMRYANSLMLHPKERYDRIIFWMVMAEFGICVVLNGCHISDYHESLKLIHSCLAFTMLFLIYMFFRNRRELKGEKAHKGEGKVILTAFVILSAFVMIDLCRYIAADNGVDDAGIFGRIGLLIFILILFLQTIMRMIDYMKKATQMETIEKIAYTDTLTQLPNRASFVKKEKELQEEMEKGSQTQIMVCQFDINNLKQVNDTLGHAYGDRHIVKAAELLTQSFCHTGTCYRVGGDEFTVFVTKEPVEESYRDSIAILEAKEKLYNESTEAKMPLSIAYGKFCIERQEKDSLEEAERKADQMMYEMKSRYKRCL